MESAGETKAKEPPPWTIGSLQTILTISIGAAVTNHRNSNKCNEMSQNEPEWYQNEQE